MAFREVRVFEVREVLRLWLRGEGIRSTERLAGVDRKTVCRYVARARPRSSARPVPPGQHPAQPAHPPPLQQATRHDRRLPRHAPAPRRRPPLLGG
jgi:hypothetical protein